MPTCKAGLYKLKIKAIIHSVSSLMERQPNKLINETSPYLLQHAHNPVEWFGWNDEAFKKAQLENKPIFLSIGYSTCHWCHVMEQESFEDKEVAKLMNDTFVSIKVDREERPDLDHIYMTVCQMLTSSGGWPLTIIMTPDKKPFFAGTYFPKHSSFGRIGMLELIPKIKELWNNNKAELLNSADEITSFLRDVSESISHDSIGPEVLDTAYSELKARFDPKYGGFEPTPKFPSPHNLLFLLRYYKRKDLTDALHMVEKTLLHMRLGGVYDQIGFGFHRYSTDAKWFLPHFEKMLYDQAMLSLTYIETYQVTGNKFYAKVVEEIFEYVLRDLTSSLGGFYSAEDADSEGEEGKFYVWSYNEIKNILGRDTEIFAHVFNVKPEGNYFDEATRKKQEYNILHLNEIVSDEQLHLKLISCREKLFEVRNKRVHPHKDDKILTDWNGLMIAALAKGGSVLQKKKYIDVALKAINFIFNNLYKEGELLHSYRNGPSKHLASLDDYAFLVWALLELYEATLEISHLEKAIVLNEKLLKLFWDDNNGGFYFTRADLRDVIVRKKELYDGAIPSGNSVAMMNLLKLGLLTNDEKLISYANKLAEAFGGEVKQVPIGHTYLLCGLDFIYGEPCKVVVVGDKKEEADIVTFLNQLKQKYKPNHVLLYLSKDEGIKRNFKTKNGKTTVYVCQNFKCSEPLTDFNKVFEVLGN